jgi:4-hydroxy-tetrahydrodipicolinate synthase
MTESGIDETALRRLVNWQIEQGIHGLVAVGTTGESATLSAEEHKRVVEIVVQESNGRVPVLAGAGSNNPSEAIVFAQYGEKVGADGLLCVAGYYNRPSQEGLYQHFKRVHDATSLPLVIYNVPRRTVVEISIDTMARLAELPRVVGVKDATGDLNRILLEQRIIQKPFSYLSGDDISALAYNANGGIGCISVTSNIAPNLCVQLQYACRDNDFVKALGIQQLLVPLHQTLFIEPNPSGVKYAAFLLGIGSEYCRLPMVSLAKETKQRIRQAMVELRLIDEVAA